MAPEDRARNVARLHPDVRELLQRSAGLPRGLALLHRAPLESIAVTLGAHPDAVERARATLESPEQRASAIDAFVRALQRHHP
jgi:hypothetical protein